MRDKRAISWTIYGVGVIGVLLLNLVAWQSRAFCDWYVRKVFPVWLGSYAKLTSLVSISVGEIMLILAVCITAFGISFFIWNCICKQAYKRKVIKFFSIYAWGFLVVGYVMTCNCFILYHTSDFAKAYLKNEDEQMVAAANDAGVITDSTASEQVAKSNYTKKNIAILRDYLVEQCNKLAPQFPRDEKGQIIVDKDLFLEAVTLMENMGTQYDRLAGDYVSPKYFTFSEFFSQQNIMGYYFPFSLEANVNKVMYVTNVVPTLCHELSHTKGFMQEYDANMIAFLACIQSEDPFVQYCGYLSVLNYVNNDFYNSIDKNKAVYQRHVRISDLVASDNIFLTKEDWEQVEKKAVVKTETVKKVSTNLMQTSLKLNGVEEGIQAYQEVVELLLDYYKNKLY